MARKNSIEKAAGEGEQVHPPPFSSDEALRKIRRILRGGLRVVTIIIEERFSIFIVTAY